MDVIQKGSAPHDRQRLHKSNAINTFFPPPPPPEKLLYKTRWIVFLRAAEEMSLVFGNLIPGQILNHLFVSLHLKWRFLTRGRTSPTASGINHRNWVKRTAVGKSSMGRFEIHFNWSCLRSGWEVPWPFKQSFKNSTLINWTPLIDCDILRYRRLIINSRSSGWSEIAQVLKEKYFPNEWFSSQHFNYEIFLRFLFRETPLLELPPKNFDRNTSLSLY